MCSSDLMDPQTIKAVWGFNGTERPGAVYLASVLATHAQKGLPAFGIYGHDVQEADDTSIPEDVKEKLLRFGRAAVAAASMRGKSYLQIGSVTMGIGGSIIDSDFIESYLGMRVESVDEVEIIRRMTEGIYDHEEFEKALKWAKETCKIGWDKNPEELQFSPEKKEEQFEFVVKMAVICRISRPPSALRLRVISWVVLLLLTGCIPPSSSRCGQLLSVIGRDL